MSCFVLKQNVQYENPSNLTGGEIHPSVKTNQTTGRNFEKCALYECGFCDCNVCHETRADL